MTDIQKVLERIEYLRQLLHALVEEAGGNLNDEEVLRLSEELDRWIVRYTQMVQRSLRSKNDTTNGDRE